MANFDKYLAILGLLVIGSSNRLYHGWEGKAIAVPDPQFAPKQETPGQAHLVLNSPKAFSLDAIERLRGGQIAVHTLWCRRQDDIQIGGVQGARIVFERAERQRLLDKEARGPRER